MLGPGQAKEDLLGGRPSFIGSLAFEVLVGLFVWKNRGMGE